MIKKVLTHKFDLPEEFLDFSQKAIAIDTEAMGLTTQRDRLCVIQIKIGDIIHVIHFPEAKYECENLKKLLQKKSIKKIFHFARFDMIMIYRYIGVLVENIVCTRILSKISRTFSDRHGLKELCKEKLKIEINKGEQTSYWGSEELTNSQVQYAAKDVEFLESLYEELKNMAERENRMEVAEKMFIAMPSLIFIECNNFDPIKLFEH